MQCTTWLIWTMDLNHNIVWCIIFLSNAYLIGFWELPWPDFYVSFSKVVTLSTAIAETLRWSLHCTVWRPFLMDGGWGLERYYVRGVYKQNKIASLRLVKDRELMVGLVTVCCSPSSARTLTGVVQYQLALSCEVREYCYHFLTSVALWQAADGLWSPCDRELPFNATDNFLSLRNSLSRRG